ncbi:MULTISPECIES: hypothetical protein [Pseudoalteromonas]|uniref:GRAM domain-containing protein n=1 Tax=Pseudoalteromonas amylolytica TaxID=1859457 RepID=A0A1S1MX86_9GAMM|nr:MULTISPECIES: hypothetical protein [Pseudoalteromonas]OHU88048.1 hypothetical protein BFC16_11685 [Pseudoalteromonas sp. JW3]OHU91488.1 hypothetical protein BET10_11805 [Pseudoalteromonas amylolytica]
MQQRTIKSTHASIQQGVAKADGTLSISAQTLTFEPFNHERGLGPYTIERAKIVKVEKCTGTGGGILPITHSAIRVILDDNHSYEFILANSELWLETLSN